MACKSKPNGSAQVVRSGWASDDGVRRSAPAALMLKMTADVTNAHGPLEQSMNGAIMPTVQRTPAKGRCAGGGRAQDDRQREHAECEGVPSFWRKGDRQPRIAEVQAADFELSKIVLPNSISGSCVPESSNGQGGHPV
jgi:hypothetical protein